MHPLIGVTFAILAGLATRDTVAGTMPSPLRGTWTLVAADKRLPDGKVVRDYGEHPKGSLIVDADGRYALQIFKSERVRFATDSKGDGSAEEFKSAAMGSSTHYGTVAVDLPNRQLVFTIDGASFPNWEGTVQKRHYTLEDDTLTYQVPPRADGSVPLSVWKRIATP